MKPDADFAGAVRAERKLHFVAVMRQFAARNNRFGLGANARFFEHSDQYVAFHPALGFVCPFAQRASAAARVFVAPNRRMRTRRRNARIHRRQNFDACALQDRIFDATPFGDDPIADDGAPHFDREFLIAVDINALTPAPSAYRVDRDFKTPKDIILKTPPFRHE